MDTLDALLLAVAKRLRLLPGQQSVRFAASGKAVVLPPFNDGVFSFPAVAIWPEDSGFVVHRANEPEKSFHAFSTMEEAVEFATQV